MYDPTLPETGPELAPPAYADFVARCLARLADLALLGVPYVAGTTLCALGVSARVLPGVSLAVAGYWAWWVLFVLYFALLTARSGQTPGKRLLGVQVQRPDGGVPGAGTLWVRTLADVGFRALGSLLPYADALSLLNYLLVAVHPRKRAGHDLVAGTVVRRVRPNPSCGVLVLVLVASAVVTRLPKEVILSGRADSPAMAPAINQGEVWIASRLAYRLGRPAMGDIVVFRAVDITLETGRHGRNVRRLGRVVGLTGDTVALHDGKLWRNGAAVNDTSGTAPPTYTWPDRGGQAVVPPGQVLVLPDNRTNLADERFWWVDTPAQFRPGPLLPVTDIIGQVVAVEVPLWRVRSVR